MSLETSVKPTSSERSYDSITTKWKTRIHSRVAKFCVIMSKSKDSHGSGENDAEDYSKSLREYRLLYGHEFTLKECWEILRGHNAWKKEVSVFHSNSRKKTKGSTTTSGSTQGPINFQDVDESDNEEETRESRPQTRDATRKKSSSSPHDPPASWTTSLAKTFSS